MKQLLKNKKFSTIFLIIPIFLTLLGFLIIDYSITNILKSSSRNIYTFKENGFYDLKPNRKNLELFGSTIFFVRTDKNGFRTNIKNNENSKFDLIMLGDSFIYGMSNYNTSIVGQLNQITNLNILNAGIPSYSPTTYLYKYKQIIKKKIGKKNI